MESRLRNVGDYRFPEIFGSPGFHIISGSGGGKKTYRDVFDTISLIVNCVSKAAASFVKRLVDLGILDFDDVRAGRDPKLFVAGETDLRNFFSIDGSNPDRRSGFNGCGRVMGKRRLPVGGATGERQQNQKYSEQLGSGLAK
jgi:hypothetical protein